MRYIFVALAILCGAVSAYAGPTAWCEGKDKLTIKAGHFYVNGRRVPDKAITDATEETMIAFEYKGRLFVPCP